MSPLPPPPLLLLLLISCCISSTRLLVVPVVPVSTEAGAADPSRSAAAGFGVAAAVAVPGELVLMW
jgi:hypothetical protein